MAAESSILKFYFNPGKFPVSRLFQILALFFDEVALIFPNMERWKEHNEIKRKKRDKESVCVKFILKIKNNQKRNFV